MDGTKFSILMQALHMHVYTYAHIRIYICTMFDEWNKVIIHSHTNFTHTHICLMEGTVFQQVYSFSHGYISFKQYKITI